MNLQSVVFLCSLLRAVFTDTHPAVLLKLAPAVATLRISQGVQFCVWVACWRIFDSKTISFFATALSSYRGGKRELWRVEAEGEDWTRVVHQAGISITAPDSEITFHCEITIIINRWARPPVCESCTLKTLLIQSVAEHFEWSTICTSTAFDFQEGPLSPHASSDCLPGWSIWLWSTGIRIMPLDDCWRWHELAGLKAPYPRERTSVDIHTTRKMMLQRWLWAMLVYVWCTGIQAINNITISNSSGSFKPPRNNSEETAETNVQ